MRRAVVWILIPVVSVLLCIGYNRFFQQAALTDPSNRPKSYSYLERPDVGAVLKDAFGSYDPETGAALWTSRQPQLNELFHGGDDPLPVQTEVILQAPFLLPSHVGYIILLSTKPPGFVCHACAPAVGGMLLRYDNHKWRREILNVFVTQSGSFGNPPRAIPARIGPERDGVFLRWHDMAQGYYVEGVKLITARQGCNLTRRSKTTEGTEGTEKTKHNARGPQPNRRGGWGLAGNSLPWRHESLRAQGRYQRLVLRRRKNHREHGEGKPQRAQRTRRKQNTTRESRNETGTAVAVSPATRSRGGVKVSARREDFRG